MPPRVMNNGAPARLLNKKPASGAGAGFIEGESVEYCSKSAGGKWISCVVYAVQADGSLILHYHDGTILKEGADPASVRKAAS